MGSSVGNVGYALHLSVLRDPGNEETRRLLMNHLAHTCKPEHLPRLQLLGMLGFWRLQRKLLQDPLPGFKILDPVEWKLFWHPLLTVKVLPGDVVAGPGSVGRGGPLGSRVYPVKPLYLALTNDQVNCQHQGCPVPAHMPQLLQTLVASPGTGWRWICGACLKHYGSRRDVPRRSEVPVER